MPETVLERHYRDRMESVRQMALPEVGRPSFSWRDVEDLVALCFELSLSGRDLLEKEYQRVFREANLTVAWLRERRRIIEELSNNYLQLAQTIRASALHAWQEAGAPSGKDFLARLDSSIQAVAETRQRVLERWPVGSDDEIAEARTTAA